MTWLQALAVFASFFGGSVLMACVAAANNRSLAGKCTCGRRHEEVVEGKGGITPRRA